jgi:enoyl-CoA hydratase/carnithine racemase
MTHELIRLNIEDQVATLELDRPPRNLLTIAMIEEINAALLSLRQWRSLQVLVLRGRDGNFSEGIDYRDHTRRKVQRWLQVFMRTFETLRLVNVISVSAVEGSALGAGFELALGCNLIVAAEDATFAMTQLHHGTIPPVGAAILPRIAPRRKAMEWILTGNTVSAARLEHDGIINRLFPPQHFDTRLAEFVTELTDKSGPVLQLAKRAQFEAYYSNFPDALANIQALYLKELLSLEDASEGPRAAREERDPTWKNA